MRIEYEKQGKMLWVILGTKMPLHYRTMTVIQNGF